MPIAAFLDESRRDRYHPILGVGGFVCDLADLRALECAWVAAKTHIGVDPSKPVRYAMTWDDPTLRLPLIEQIPNLGIVLKGVAALLEDFRPGTYVQRRETRKDMYVQRRAFEYVLQRLVEPQYLSAEAVGPHLVFADRHDDFRCYHEEYEKLWARGRTFPSGRRIAPLSNYDFAAAPASMHGGPAMEVADLVLSVAIRWVEAMVARDDDKPVQDMQELDAGMLALLPLFPTNPSATISWRGYSIIAHRGRRTGKEIIYDRIDSWFRELQRRAGSAA